MSWGRWRESILLRKVSHSHMGQCHVWYCPNVSSDPEEFLNMLFKHTLHVEPFIQIK